MKNTTILSLFLAMLFATGAQAGNTTTTVSQVTDGVELTTDVDYVITSTDPFTTFGSVNIVNTEHAVVIFKNIKPSKVISTYLSNIYINGEQAVSDGNCQVRMYNTGAIVFPYDDTAALTCYTEENFGGDSYNGYRIGNSGGYMLSLNSTSLNNSIRSFKLKRGYMVTFAVGTNGWGYSRCFIADQEDLEVSSVPYPLNGKISSYRLFHWYNAQKKGLANDTGATSTDVLNVTSCYSFGLGESRLPDAECVPHHIYEGWPAISDLGSRTYSCHMKTNNEPGNDSDPYPQTVDEVLANWQDLMRTGMRLCSESSHDGSWYHLQNFMDSIDARGWRCDIVDLHCYWDGEFNSLSWYIDTYGHDRPIWISEWVWGASWNNNGIFGAVSDPSSFSTANQQACYNGTKPILDKLNSNSRVERYFYWNSENVASRIYNNGQLSILGEYYSTMDSGLGYNAANEFVPKVVFHEPGELTSTYTKKAGTMELAWIDPNGDMLDSILVECKLPDTSKWVTLSNVAPKDKSSSSDIEYSYTDTPTEPGLYTYRVTEYYTNASGKRAYFRTNEENCTVSASYSVGSLQYGQLELAGNEAVSTDIETQDVAPYVVMGMVSNKNSSNGITNQITTLAKSSFKFRLYPWTLPTPVEISSAETVDYMILPPDTVYHLSDDMMLISANAGKVKGDEVQVLFPVAFPEGVTPVVVAQQNTATTSYAPVTVKVWNVTNEGFSVKLVRQEEVTSTFATENVNYFACTPGQVAIGDGKMLTVGRDHNTPCGGSSRQTVYFTNEIGDTLHFISPYIIAAPQTNNYGAASVFRQHSTTSDDDGVYCASIRRQVDSTSTIEETNKASENGDYIGWFVISDNPDETDDTEPVIVPTSIENTSEKGFSVYSADGCLWTDNPLLRAYNSAGLRVPFGTELPAGVYIITDGVNSRKLLLKR